MWRYPITLLLLCHKKIGKQLPRSLLWEAHMDCNPKFLENLNFFIVSHREYGPGDQEESGSIVTFH